MDAGRVDASSLRTLVVDPSAVSRTFVPGQHLTGRVLQALGDQQFVLTFGDRQVLAQSALPLVPGQEIAVEVMKAGHRIELRLEQPVLPASPSGDHTYALATVLQALKAAEGADAGALAPDGAALLQALGALQQAGRTSVPAPQAEALARLLQPLAVTGDPRTLAAAVRDLFENSGLLFEARVRAVLESLPGATLDQVLTALQADLKAILGRLARDAAGWPKTDGAIDQELARGAASMDTAARTLVDQQSVLANQLLGRQADFALRWLADGTVRFDLPVRLPAGDARVAIRLRRDRDADVEPGQPPAFSITLRLDQEALGAIEARARWWGSTVQAVFHVASDTTRDLLRSELDSLTERLGAVFTNVTADVRVDATPLRDEAGPEPLLELPGGSIVNVRV
jgi:hypothetical protein